MGKQAFEHLLGFHGAPLLVGMKPAVLLSFRKDRFEDFDALLASYAPCFHCKGITVRRLAEGEVHAKRVSIRSQHKQSAVLEMILDEGKNRYTAFLTVIDLEKQVAERRGDAPPD